MSFKEEIVQKIGTEVFRKLEDRANEEVAVAMQMELVDQYNAERFYKTRLLLPQFVEEYKLFEELDLNISPEDIVNVLFRCKLLYAAKTEQEYRQRVGGGSWVEEVKFTVPWSKRSEKSDVLINEYFERLKSFVKEGVLVTRVESLYLDTKVQQNFFDQLFAKLNLPFHAFFDEDSLVSLQNQISRYHAKTLDEAKRFFSWPSVGYKIDGSYLYGYWQGMAQLRTFFALLKIFVYIRPGQRSFGDTDVQIMAATHPVFLNTGAMGAYMWEEDTKVSWMKLPDGCLFNSFGYRGVSKMWIDTRNMNTIEVFFIEHKHILSLMQNPWLDVCRLDIAPTLDILSSATQIQDLGAKILLLYCSLEHLFVPKNVNKNNAHYIIGGINALARELLPWFEGLYKLRCDYAHKGYVLKSEDTRLVIEESFKNVMKLLSLKISNVSIGK